MSSLQVRLSEKEREWDSGCMTAAEWQDKHDVLAKQLADDRTTQLEGAKAEYAVLTSSAHDSTTATLNGRYIDYRSALWRAHIASLNQQHSQLQTEFADKSG